jgi:hypothetical protein
LTTHASTSARLLTSFTSHKTNIRSREQKQQVKLSSTLFFQAQHQIMSSSTATILSSALYFVIFAQPSTYAFAPQSNSLSRTTSLRYRSIHHGPDVQPLTEAERLGAEYTKMNKDLIINYGPGMFDGFADSDQFDGGDSEMGLTGDGTTGLQKLGR